jgi:hypothetical protein
MIAARVWKLNFSQQTFLSIHTLLHKVVVKNYAVAILEDFVNVVRIRADPLRSHETPSLVHFANCHLVHKGCSLFLYSQIHKTDVHMTLYEFCATYKHITLLEKYSVPHMTLFNIP